jgi:hypothetical protein
LEDTIMHERPLTPSEAKIARRNFALLCGAATVFLGLVVLFTVLMVA